MNTQLLRALNERLSGEYYIGRATTTYDPYHSVQQGPPPATTFPRPQVRYEPNPDIDTPETASTINDDTVRHQGPVEYRIPGLDWYTEEYENTCTMDSFLTAFIRRVRQTHGHFLNKVVFIDRVGEALIQIGNHALTAKDNIDSARIKLLWLQAVLRSSGELMNLCNPPVDCTGINTYSIFQHLFHHGGFEIISQCPCGMSYHQDFVLEVPNLHQLQILGTPQILNAAQMPKCLTCGHVRVLMELNPLDDNWLLVFNYNGSIGKNNQSPNLDNIPPIVAMGTLRFKLEYLCYKHETIEADVLHEISLHKIRNEWYFYDDCRSQNPKRWYGKNYNMYNAHLCTIVYFRI
jgi:hypothetical protein